MVNNYKFLNKFFSILATISLLINSLATPFVALAQEDLFTPTPEPTIEATTEPTLAPTEVPTEIPSATPVETVAATQTPDATVEATQSPTEAPVTQEATNENSQAVAPPTTTSESQPQETTTPTSIATQTPTIDTTEELITTTIVENIMFSDSLQENNWFKLVTDKLDYAPTEMAIISGTGFDANKTYQITVSSTDDPATSTTEGVTTNSNGEFTYYYQLDGIYRPNYLVEVKENLTIVATVTFTDSPISGTTIDSAGANDEPGQKDMTKMSVDYTGLPNSIFVTWNWDEIKWTGNNTGDGCSLFDTDNDGLVNYSLCVIISGNPASYQSKALYSCGDNATNKCTSPVASIVPSVNTICSAAGSTDDPFPTGDEYNKDTKAQCTISLNDVGGTGVAQLVDVCSYPSQQPNSDPSDCIVFKQNSGKIEVVKNVIPTTDSGLFNLQIDGVNQATNVTNNGTTGEKVLITGNHTVGETAGTNTNLSNYSTNIVCKDLNGTGQTVASSNSTGPLNVNLSDNQDIVCTITNTRINNATLTIIKDAQPNSSQDFAFTTTGTGLSNFSLDDDSDNTLSNTKVFSNLGSGIYTVAENATNGWSQSSATCSDNSPVNNINLSSGENVTCTFTNTRDTGEIVIHKIIDNDNNIATTIDQVDGENWVMDVDGTGIDTDDPTLTNTDVDGLTSTGQIKTGEYTAIEGTQQGYVVLGASCTGGQGNMGTFDKIDSIDGIVLGKNETITCTFVNFLPQPSLTSVKSKSELTPDEILVGDTTTYKAVVTNTGNVTLYNPVVYDYFDTDHVDYVSSSPVNAFSVTEDIGPDTQDYDNDGDTTEHIGLIIWQIPVDLAMNDVYTITFNFVATSITPDTQNLEAIAGNGIYTEVCTVNTQDCSQENTITTPYSYAGVDIDDLGSVSGTKFNDANGDGIWNNNETTIQGVEIKLGNLTTTTNSSGDYSFENLAAGDYQVCETVPAGYTRTYPQNCHSFTITENGETITDKDFGNALLSKIYGYKYDDQNGDGVDDGDWTPVVNWVIELWQNNQKINEATTDSNGYYEFKDLVFGAYTLVEQMVSGWTNVSPTSINANVVPGDNVTSYDFVNTQYGHIIVEKQTLPNGSTESFEFQTDYGSNFELQDGQQNDSGELEPAIGYSVTETVTDGWNLTNIACTSSIGDTETAENLELDSGETITCVFTNSKLPLLTVNKVVVNDNGGDMEISDFPLFVNGNQVVSGQTYTYTPDDYLVTETSDDGYVATFSGGCDEQGNVKLDYGDDKTCTITNDDIAPKLTLIKTVITDNGGDKQVSDFPLFINGTPVTSGQENVLSANTLYTATETNLAGYTPSVWGGDCAKDGTITLNAGDNKTCTITNDDQPATLIVKKVVINDNGGTSKAEDFSFSINGGSSFDFEVDGQNEFTVNAGEYSVEENTANGYTTSYDNCTEVEITNGGTATCTITNDDISPKLTVIKEVINDDGGNAVSSDFTMNVDGTNVSDISFPGNATGTTVTLDAGEYSVDEDSFVGYAKTLGQNCSGTIALGEEITCTITNDDIAPTITLYKEVNNNYNGPLKPSDFTLTIGGNTAVQGVTTEVNANTNYAINENAEDGYEFVEINGDNCPESLGGTVNLSEGEDIVCTIVNQDLPGTLIVKKVIETGDASYGDFSYTINDGESNTFEKDGENSHTVNAGTYTIIENQTTGYTPSYDNCSEIEVKNGETQTCTITNTRDLGNILVHKIIDEDGNLETTDDQTDGNNWEFTVNQSSQSTDVNGLTTFEDLETGIFSVTETLVEGFDLIAASCDTGTQDGNTVYSVVVNKDSTTECTFYNTPNGAIHGYKWEDVNGNGEEDENEDRLSGWTINLYGWDDEGNDYTKLVKSATTSSDIGFDFGWYWFNHLFPGTYKICEVMQDNWIQTYPGTEDGCYMVDVPQNNEEAVQNGVFAPTNNFGNMYKDPSINIVKSNNKSQAQAGDTVSYVLKVTNTGNMNLSNVEVWDNIPGQFSYVLGTSTLNGLAVSDPTISGNTLKWTLEGLEKGEFAEISYQVKISGSATNGIYKNLATCTAEVGYVGRLLRRILVDQEESQKETIECNVADSSVTIGSGNSFGGNLRGQVLGASTELPDTGSPTALLLLALTGLTTGFVLNKKYAKN